MNFLTSILAFVLFIFMTIETVEAQSRSDRSRLRESARNRNRTANVNRGSNRGSRGTVRTNRGANRGSRGTVRTNRGANRTVRRDSSTGRRNSSTVRRGGRRTGRVIHNGNNRTRQRDRLRQERRRVNRHGRAYGRYNHRVFVPYRHSRRAVNRHYRRSLDYYNYIYGYNRNYIYRNWIRVPSTRAFGFHFINGYPYYVFNGYRYRYSNYDLCDYQLVDTRYSQAIESYIGQTCAIGLDRCMDDANYENSFEYGRPYQCLETYRY